MATLTHTYTQTYNETRFADPYKQCLKCGGWVDGVLNCPGPTIVTPCEHRAEYRDTCSSWGPVDGCTCPTGRHAMRTPADDGKTY
jgi:hypothetical protein